jgi:hypothetical protein
MRALEMAVQGFVVFFLLSDTIKVPMSVARKS